MHIDQTVFVKLMFGAFGMVIVAFTVRGLSTIAVGSETAMMVASPLFVVAVLLAVLAFVLAVLVKIGVLEDSPHDDQAESA